MLGKHFDPGDTHYVAVKCKKCKKWDASQTVSQFKREHKEEYQAEGSVSLRCVECGEYTDHTIIGKVVIRHIRMKAGDVLV